MVSPTVSGGNNSGSSRGEDASVQMFSNKRINVCLDDTNFLLWKQQVILTIRGLGLEEYIDPDVTKPTRYVERAAGERVLNPEYVQFVKQDSSLASWLLSTVSADILPQLVGADTSAEIWSVITGLYSKLSTTKIMHLHCKLRSMKKGAMSMRKVAEVEHIATILNGLPSEFAPFVAVITASKEPFSLDGVVSVLVDAESRLMVDVVESPIGINLSQFHATESTGGPDHNKSYSNQGRGRGSRNIGYNRGGRFRGRSRPQCQLCGKIGHMVDTCWYRFDENFKGIGSQQIRQGDDPQANMCHYQGSGPYYEPFIADTAGISGVTGTVESSQPVEAAQINSLVASGISVNDAGGNSASDGVAQECNLPVCLPSSDLGNNDSENSVSTAPLLEAVSSTANEHSEASDSVSPDCFSGVPDLAANADYQESAMFPDVISPTTPNIVRHSTGVGNESDQVHSVQEQQVSGAPMQDQMLSTDSQVLAKDQQLPEIQEIIQEQSQAVDSEQDHQVVSDDLQLFNDNDVVSGGESHSSDNFEAGAVSHSVNSANRSSSSLHFSDNAHSAVVRDEVMSQLQHQSIDLPVERDSHPIDNS
ncbi:hypothetical protein GQ457_18G015830 [Hibiscus cannabinus]